MILQVGIYLYENRPYRHQNLSKNKYVDGDWMSDLKFPWKSKTLPTKNTSLTQTLNKNSSYDASQI